MTQNEKEIHNMAAFTLNPIGRVEHTQQGTQIRLDEKFIPALEGLEGFSHIQLLYWFDGCDFPQARSLFAVEKPYVKGPDTLGIFATRSPARPNPIALSSAQITYIDRENGVIGLTYADANEGSPVLDIKPYTPSLDRVESPYVPAWCAHWPKNTETSGEFDWGAEFNF